jgi:hypothetical protein
VSPTAGGRADRAAIPDDAHEWVEFEDPEEERTWRFDVTFLLSPWTCIFGQGCQGVLTGPAPELVQGCCSYGAHFTDDEDVARTRRIAATLDASTWQFKDRAKRGGIIRKQADGTRITRLVDGACIFLNRPGFGGGPGCAFHKAAMDRGVPHHELKPDVCWQLPLRREDTVADDGHVTSTLGQWDRRHWGPGGEEFHWWCTEEPAAFVGHEPVSVEMAGEIEAMVGTAVADMLAAYLRTRRAARGVPLPHPVVRRGGGA